MGKAEVGIIVIDKLILPVLQPSAIQTSHLCSSSKNKKNITMYPIAYLVDI